MDPLQVLNTTGRKRDWIARQMGISESYLSLLLNGKRRWTADLQTRFALATGVPAALISFCASECDGASHDTCACVTVEAAEALDSAQGERAGASEYSATRTATTGR